MAIMKTQRKENVLFQNVKPREIPLVDNPFSTYPYKHVITETQPTQAKNQAIWGLVQMGLSGEAAAMYGDVVVQKTTRACRKSEGGFKDVNTELWGTSPYLGRGDGEVYNMPASNQLLRGFESSLRGSRVRTQIDDKSFIPYTWQTIDVPLAAAKTSFIAGLDTRQQLAYGNP
ncbi:hypothetical protein PBCVCvsA1_580R [Paramecium bursaria Chlorella virus CvsA1]|nr:hypothetical protein PBCVCviKI_563R [Paramecium bursaria Chlorella virus CviKI]AGE52628.1 hypothetical protein PBCVCvsA1_580R [Paramecium bursaria Chlorella virus CvsA1]AGE55421.1 hypothetical protein PBCVMA1E_671R [Paramecium bursaria Chlorella virus MA1E]